MVVLGHGVVGSARRTSSGAVFGLPESCCVTDASLGTVLGFVGHSPQMTSICRFDLLGSVFGRDGPIPRSCPFAIS
jgi:hypothetical protein